MHTATQWVALPRFHPLLHNRPVKTKKNMAQMKEQIKAPKTELSNEGIDLYLSDAEFKTLVMRMLTDMVEHGCKIRGRSEGYAK